MPAVPGPGSDRERRPFPGIVCERRSGAHTAANAAAIEASLTALAASYCSHDAPSRSRSTGTLSVIESRRRFGRPSSWIALRRRALDKDAVSACCHATTVHAVRAVGAVQCIVGRFESSSTWARLRDLQQRPNRGEDLVHSSLGAATNDGLNLSMLRQALHRVVQPSFERGDASDNGGRAAAGGLGDERLRRHANSHPRGTGQWPDAATHGLWKSVYKSSTGGAFYGKTYSFDAPSLAPTRAAQ